VLAARDGGPHPAAGDGGSCPTTGVGGPRARRATLGGGAGARRNTSGQTSPSREEQQTAELKQGGASSSGKWWSSSSGWTLPSILSRGWRESMRWKASRACWLCRGKEGGASSMRSFGSEARRQFYQTLE
jgi:hypothetical protein